jgi:hypothetical protein
MARVIAADGAAVDNGFGTLHGEILWQEVRILGYVIVPFCETDERLTCTGWAKWMEWKYPVEIVVTSPGAFKLAGAVEAAASL